MAEQYRPEIDGPRTVGEAIALLNLRAKAQSKIADSYRLHLETLNDRTCSAEYIRHAHAVLAGHDMAARVYRDAAVTVEMARDRERVASAATQ
jgi:hypothetical protein